MSHHRSYSSIPKGPAGNVDSPNIKAMVDLLSDRLLFYTQHADVERKLKQHSNQHQRCQNGDFQSAVSFWDVQCKAVDLEKAKMAQMMSAIDAKLVDAMTSLWLNLQDLIHAQALAAVSQKTLSPPPTEISSQVALRIDESQNMLRNEIALASQNLQSSFRAEYGAQILELQQGLQHERSLRTGLETEIQNLSARLVSIESKVKDQAKLSSLLDKTVKQDALTELESRLAKVEASDSPAIEAANETNITPDQVISQHLEPKFADMQDHFQSEICRMAKELGAFIDEERKQRAAMSKKMNGSSETICAKGQDTQECSADLQHLHKQACATAKKVEALEADFVPLRAAHEMQTWSLKQHELQLQKASCMISSAQEDVKNVKQNLDKSMEAYSMRLDGLASWQNNFNARPLFDAITQHLNDTLMIEHISYMNNLREKLSNLERQFEELSNKRRKLVGYGPILPQ